MSAVRRNILALYILQGANYLLPLIVVPYLVRVLGATGYGRVAFAQGFIGYFVVLTDYGFNLSATRAVALARNDRTALSRVFSAVIFVKAAFMSVYFGIMLALITYVPQLAHDRTLYLLTFLSVLGNVLFPVWLFQGLERMRAITTLTISARLLTSASIFFFVHSRGDYRIAAALQASSSVIAGIAALMLIPSMTQLRIRWPGISMLRTVTSDGWHVFLSTAAISLYTSSSVFVLGILSNPAVVGYFSAAQKLIRAVASLVSPLSQAVFPRVAFLAERDRTAALAFAGRLLLWQGLATLVMSVAVFIFARPLVFLVLGPRFAPSVPVVLWMAPLPLIIGLSNVFGVQIMLNFGMKKTFSRILILSALTNVLLLVPLAHWFAAQGAAISVLVTEFVVTASMYIALRLRRILPQIGAPQWAH